MRTLNNYLKPVLSTLLCVVALFVLSCEQDRADTPEPLAAIAEADIMGVGPHRPVSAYHNKVLADIRMATARYHSVELAEQDGYVLNSPCVTGPTGAMGHHYLNIGYVLDGVVDPSKPEALLYEPQKNGKMKLVAVEFIIMSETWDAMHSSPPMLGDQVFDDFSLGGGGPPFPNYQLHAWVWKHNPDGMHARYNPEVSCEYAQ